MNWHVANLEYGNCTSLDNVGLRHWDQDDEWAYHGEHKLLRHGYHPLIARLATGMNVRLRCVARAHPCVIVCVFFSQAYVPVPDPLI